MSIVLVGNDRDNDNDLLWPDNCKLTFFKCQNLNHQKVVVEISSMHPRAYLKCVENGRLWKFEHT